MFYIILPVLQMDDNLRSSPQHKSHRPDPKPSLASGKSSTPAWRPPPPPAAMMQLYECRNNLEVKCWYKALYIYTKRSIIISEYFIKSWSWQWLMEKCEGFFFYGGWGCVCGWREVLLSLVKSRFKGNEKSVFYWTHLCFPMVDVSS